MCHENLSLLLLLAIPVSTVIVIIVGWLFIRKEGS